MVTSIRNKNLNYIQYGSGEDIVLLHGWGQNIEMMKPLGDCFPDKRITILDFPGFGLSDEPKEVIGVDGYTTILEKLLKRWAVA